MAAARIKERLRRGSDASRGSSPHSLSLSTCMQEHTGLAEALLESETLEVVVQQGMEQVRSGILVLRSLLHHKEEGGTVEVRALG